jgi:hypothetical protein
MPKKGKKNRMKGRIKVHMRAHTTGPVTRWLLACRQADPLLGVTSAAADAIGDDDTEEIKVPPLRMSSIAHSLVAC